MIGEGMRFTDQDGAEETWPTMRSLLNAPPWVHPYAKVSWGSGAADKLVAGLGGWRGCSINS
jgi:glucose-6-phosphate 1-dehydrogenase